MFAAVRHHQAGGGGLVEGAQEVQQDEEVHGEAGELQLRRGPGQVGILVPPPETPSCPTSLTSPAGTG